MLLKPTVVMVAYPHSKPLLGTCVTNFEIYTAVLNIILHPEDYPDGIMTHFKVIKGIGDSFIFKTMKVSF